MFKFVLKTARTNLEVISLYLDDVVTLSTYLEFQVRTSNFKYVLKVLSTYLNIYISYISVSSTGLRTP